MSIITEANLTEEFGKKFDEINAVAEKFERMREVLDAGTTKLCDSYKYDFNSDTGDKVIQDPIKTEISSINMPFLESYPIGFIDIKCETNSKKSIIDRNELISKAQIILDNLKVFNKRLRLDAPVVDRLSNKINSFYQYDNLKFENVPPQEIVNTPSGLLVYYLCCDLINRKINQVTFDKQIIEFKKWIDLRTFPQDYVQFIKTVAFSSIKQFHAKYLKPQSNVLDMEYYNLRQRLITCHMLLNYYSNIKAVTSQDIETSLQSYLTSMFPNLEKYVSVGLNSNFINDYAILENNLDQEEDFDFGNDEWLNSTVDLNSGKGGKDYYKSVFNDDYSSESSQDSSDSDEEKEYYERKKRPLPKNFENLRKNKFLNTIEPKVSITDTIIDKGVKKTIKKNTTSIGNDLKNNTIPTNTMFKDEFIERKSLSTNLAIFLKPFAGISDSYSHGFDFNSIDCTTTLFEEYLDNISTFQDLWPNLKKFFEFKNPLLPQIEKFFTKTYDIDTLINSLWFVKNICEIDTDIPTSLNTSEDGTIETNETITAKFNSKMNHFPLRIGFRDMSVILHHFSNINVNLKQTPICTNVFLDISGASDISLILTLYVFGYIVDYCNNNKDKNERLSFLTSIITNETLNLSNTNGSVVDMTSIFKKLVFMKISDLVYYLRSSIDETITDEFHKNLVTFGSLKINSIEEFWSSFAPLVHASRIFDRNSENNIFFTGPDIPKNITVQSMFCSSNLLAFISSNITFKELIGLNSGYLKFDDLEETLTSILKNVYMKIKRNSCEKIDKGKGKQTTSQSMGISLAAYLYNLLGIPSNELYYYFEDINTLLESGIKFFNISRIFPEQTQYCAYINAIGNLRNTKSIVITRNKKGTSSKMVTLEILNGVHVENCYVHESVFLTKDIVEKVTNSEVGFILFNNIVCKINKVLPLNMLCNVYKKLKSLKLSSKWVPENEVDVSNGSYKKILHTSTPVCEYDKNFFKPCVKTKKYGKFFLKIFKNEDYNEKESIFSFFNTTLCGANELFIIDNKLMMSGKGNDDILNGSCGNYSVNSILPSNFTMNRQLGERSFETLDLEKIFKSNVKNFKINTINIHNKKSDGNLESLLTQINFIINENNLYLKSSINILCSSIDRLYKTTMVLLVENIAQQHFRSNPQFYTLPVALTPPFSQIINHLDDSIFHSGFVIDLQKILILAFNPANLSKIPEHCQVFINMVRLVESGGTKYGFMFSTQKIFRAYNAQFNPSVLLTFLAMVNLGKGLI
jgi:hypothetical protein